jgi:5S rRNA maturation endonuclease (ribonuclease M5)
MATKSKRKKRLPHLLEDYVRVTPECPCPKCGRPDWCLIHKSGLKVICTRVKSGNPRGKSGHLHYIKQGQVPPKLMLQKPEYLTPKQVQDYLDGISQARNANMIERQAKALGLSLDSIVMMHGRYDPDKAVLVFPMFEHRKMPTGCRFRRNDGKKYSLKGGREGLFFSREFTPTRPTWITEGPTDAAALCEIGFTNVIGRPNCSGGADIIKRLLSTHRTTPLIIISDPDECGVDGAKSLAQMVSNPTIVLVGPSDIRDFATKRLKNDARASIIEGITGDDVTTWQPAWRNLTGQFFDFVGALQKKGIL